MSESTTENETPTPAPPVEGGPTPATDNSSTTEKRYAAYDDTYLRFVPGVYKSRKDAAAAAKAAGVKKHSIREV
jgi:hypothetical protein